MTVVVTGSALWFFSALKMVLHVARPDSTAPLVLLGGSRSWNWPAPYCGMGGANVSEAHFDICCRNTSLYLDGELIIENEQFVPADLRMTSDRF